MKKITLLILFFLTTSVGVSQTVTTVIDCSSGAYDFNYCYNNNDDIQFAFTSATGDPVRITFNSGNLEDGFDVLNILDTNGATIAAGVTDEVAGLTYTSTGDTLTVVFDTDGSVSCGLGSQTPINASVNCVTCTSPSVSFVTVEDCLTDPNNPTFNIEANIADFGTVSSVQVQDDQGGAIQTPTSPGILTFGPYAIGLDVNLMLTTDDVNCTVNSGPLAGYCPVKPNECSMVFAGNDQTFNCVNNTITLDATFQLTGQDTTEYELNTLGDCPTPPISGGSPTGLDIDDRWSQVIDMGFDFCFYGDTYNQLLVGANGGISFNISNAGLPSGWFFNSPIPNNTSSTLADVNIFAAYHDINPEACGEVNYNTLGVAPNRQFIVNYNEVCQFSCGTQKASMQVILYEGSNVIDINVFEKPSCSWNNGSAVLGIQNMTGDNGIAPAGRNTGVWSVDPASPELYRFSPGLSATPNYSFEWTQNGVSIGNTETIVVNPTDPSTTYVASVTYDQCSGPSITLTDSVTVTLNAPISDTSFNLEPACNSVVANVTGETGGEFVFNPVPTDGATINASTGEIANVTLGSTYTVEYSIDPTSICGSTTSQTITVTELPSCVFPQGISPNNDGLNDRFDLSSYDVQSIEIFSRTGRKVYVKKDGYTNEWFGQSKDGDELPTGTYYYVIKYKGNEVKASYVYINR